MKKKFVLFDLDGTLLPMDQDVFTESYFRLLTAKLAPRGYRPEALIDGIWRGTAAMVKNDGSMTNEEAFWKTFAKVMGEEALKDRPLIEEFYRVEFQQAAAFCGYNPEAARTVALCKALGFRTALATNPLFPAFATQSRIRWAGLEPGDFAWYTTYENSRWCKPSLGYYRELTQRLGCGPKDCLMIGNDVGEDMVAGALGMETFLLTDCMINKGNADISQYPHGGFPELQKWLREKGRAATAAMGVKSLLQ